MTARGWTVVTVDIDPAFRPDITADLRDWSWTGPRPHLLWSSPPCLEFSRESMPWTRTGQPPNMDLIRATHRIITDAKPIYWILENVRGAVPFLGPPTTHIGPFYLWGSFPDLGQPTLNHRKQSHSGRHPSLRAKIPQKLSATVALAIETQLGLLWPAWPAAGSPKTLGLDRGTPDTGHSPKRNQTPRPIARLETLGLDRSGPPGDHSPKHPKENP